MSRLSAEQLEALRHIDSPTISNAIEQFNVRSLVEGYAGWELRCAFPEIGTTIGYAVTCTGDTTTASRTGDRAAANFFERQAGLAIGGYRDYPVRPIGEGIRAIVGKLRLTRS